MREARTIAIAKRLRREMTSPEVLLWQRLRVARREVRFRRQHPMGPYVIDFYCPAARLAVEIDGFAHDAPERVVRDAVRDRWLRERGIEIVRVRAADVFRDSAGVAEGLFRLVAGVRAMPPPPAAPAPPPLAGEEGG